MSDIITEDEAKELMARVKSAIQMAADEKIITAYERVKVVLESHELLRQERDMALHTMEDQTRLIKRIGVRKDSLRQKIEDAKREEREACAWIVERQANKLRSQILREVVPMIRHRNPQVLP